MKGFVDYWKNYFNFKDRTSRKDFWMTVLILVIINVVINLIFPGASETTSNSFNYSLSTVGSIWSLATFIPSLAMTVRRLHDINKSGWWVLLELVPIVGIIVLLVFYCSKAVDTDNKYGKVL
ncbi:MAG: DUF805 domain-containing protein [Bacilli bacterium]|nr:DUF805 domain-containing protein [Bacilli bacterium]